MVTHNGFGVLMRKHVCPEGQVVPQAEIFQMCVLLLALNGRPKFLYDECVFLLLRPLTTWLTYMFWYCRRKNNVGFGNTTFKLIFEPTFLRM